VPSCAHLDHVRLTRLPESVDGCEDCLVTGDVWLHLRICRECGHVGCCDDSPNRHASAHANGSGHPIIRSLEPGEEWSWCYLDRLAMIIPGVEGETRIPPRRCWPGRAARTRLAPGDRLASPPSPGRVPAHRTTTKGHSLPRDLRIYAFAASRRS